MNVRNDEYMIEHINRAIAELVTPRYTIQKYYNYYNGRRDPEQFRYLEENFGVGQPTAIEFTPLVRKHIDALIGEYLEVPIIPKVSCKDKDTISKITRDKEIEITSQVMRFLKNSLNKTILQFINGQSTVDQAIEFSLNQIIEDINEGFTSKYEIAAQHVVQYIIQNRRIDFQNKLKALLLNLLITGETYYQVHPSPSKNNIEVEIHSPLNVFPDRNPNSVYVKDSYRIVVRRWMTKSEILVKYGDQLDQEAINELEERSNPALENSYMYVRSFENIPTGAPSTIGLEAGREVIPGFPYDNNFQLRHHLLPVYEVEWIEYDKENGRYIENRYCGTKICDSIYILTGKDDSVIRSKDNPEYCSLSVNGIFFTNNSGQPYSLMGACMHLQDKYDIIMYFKDSVISNSGTAGDWIDLRVLPTVLGADLIERIQKFIGYKKTGIAPIDSSQDGMGVGNNTIYNGYDDTLKLATMQAFDLALERIENTCSSITGVFRERLNGISQKDAVTNVQVGINNSYTVTKQYHQQMDTLCIDMLSDCLDQGKIVWKKGLTGTIILGDTYQKVFTALPEHFTTSDYDIHIIASGQIMKELSTVQQVCMEYVKSGQLDPDLLVDAMTSQSLTELKSKVSKAFKLKKKENDQIGQLTQQLQESQQQLQQAQKQIEQLNAKLEKLNERKINIEEMRLKNENSIDWYDQQTKRRAVESQVKNDTKRTEIEWAQQFDNNPYNDKIRKT